MLSIPWITVLYRCLKPVDELVFSSLLISRTQRHVFKGDNSGKKRHILQFRSLSLSLIFPPLHSHCLRNDLTDKLRLFLPPAGAVRQCIERSLYCAVREYRGVVVKCMSANCIGWHIGSWWWKRNMSQCKKNNNYKVIFHSFQQLQKGKLRNAFFMQFLFTSIQHSQ